MLTLFIIVTLWYIRVLSPISMSPSSIQLFPMTTFFPIFTFGDIYVPLPIGSESFSPSTNNPSKSAKKLFLNSYI